MRVPSSRSACRTQFQIDCAVGSNSRDSEACHYLKILMDAVFGPENFWNEIIWKRTSGHSDAKRFGRVHDVILYYSKSQDRKWNLTYQEYDPAYVEQYYRYEDSDGRRFMSDNLSASGLQGGGYEYEWKGITRVWRCPIETMEQLDKDGQVFYTQNGIARGGSAISTSRRAPISGWETTPKRGAGVQEQVKYHESDGKSAAKNGTKRGTRRH